LLKNASDLKEKSSRSLDATYLYFKKILASMLLSTEEEMYYGRMVLCEEGAGRTQIIESNFGLLVKNVETLYQSRFDAV